MSSAVGNLQTMGALADISLTFLGNSSSNRYILWTKSYRAIV